MVLARRASVLSVASALLLAVLVGIGCGEAGPSPEERARAAREQQFRATADKVEKLLLSAAGLAAAGNPAQAWTPWKEARNLAGETPALARTRDIIRSAEAGIARDDELDRVRGLIGRGNQVRTEAERIASLSEVADAVRSFLEQYPHVGPTDREELLAALQYADGELTIVRDYNDLLAEATAHFKAGRHRKCVAACNRALSVRNREEVVKLRVQACQALTPRGMIFIRGGRFLSGRDRNPTILAPFYIDRTEVTNADFHAFCVATDREMPEHFIGGKPPPGKELCPVTYVTIEEALAYAAWAGKRIPSEQEWERAARGTEGRAYPWGEDWDPAKGHFGDGGTLPVGTKPLDRSPDGVMDMGGNVTEFTLSILDGAGTEQLLGVVLKGGHWSDDRHPEYALTFERYEVERNHLDSGTGFRCVTSIEELGEDDE